MAAFCISTTGAGEFDHRCPRGVSFRNGYFDGGPIHYRWGSATDCGGPPRTNSDTRDKSSKRDHNSIKWQYLEHPKSPSALRAIDQRRKKKYTRPFITSLSISGPEIDGLRNLPP